MQSKEILLSLGNAQGSKVIIVFIQVEMYVAAVQLEKRGQNRMILSLPPKKMVLF